MFVEIRTTPALTEDALKTFLTPQEFDSLAAAVRLSLQLLDKAEDGLLRAAFHEWTPAELEQWVGYCELEPSTEGEA